MLNTRELEKRWLIYKIKSYIPHTIITVSIILIVSIITLFIDKRAEVETSSTIKEHVEITQKKAPITAISKPPAPIKKEKIIKVKEPVLHKDSKLRMEPSLGFMKKIQNNTLPYYKTDVKRKTNTVKEKVVSRPKVKQTVKPIKKEKQQINRSKIIIERRNTRDDIHNIIKRFKKNNNPALSLFIAKKYYELGEYHNAYNYALITNQINRDIEASWIVFSKSLVKLGEKDMAIKTLREYIKSSHSNNAKLLLEDIISGKLK